MNNLWYSTLEKPPFTPPAQYFPIAWSILYALMTIAFFVILFKPNSQNKYIAINLFILQLILNFTWSYVFFGMQSPMLGLIDVIFLFIVLAFTIFYFFKLSKLAGILMIPYLLQVIFAIYLNVGIVVLN